MDGNYLNFLGFKALINYFKSQLDSAEFWLFQFQIFEKCNYVDYQKVAITALNILFMGLGKVAKEFYDDSETLDWNNKDFNPVDHLTTLPINEMNSIDETLLNNAFFACLNFER